MAIFNLSIKPRLNEDFAQQVAAGKIPTTMPYQKAGFLRSLLGDNSGELNAKFGTDLTGMRQGLTADKELQAQRTQNLKELGTQGFGFNTELALLGHVLGQKSNEADINARMRASFALKYPGMDINSTEGQAKLAGLTAANIEAERTKATADKTQNEVAQRLMPLQEDNKRGELGVSNARNRNLQTFEQQYGMDKLIADATKGTMVSAGPNEIQFSPMFGGSSVQGPQMREEQTPDTVVNGVTIPGSGRVIRTMSDATVHAPGMNKKASTKARRSKLTTKPVADASTAAPSLLGSMGLGTLSAGNTNQEMPVSNVSAIIGEQPRSLATNILNPNSGEGTLTPEEAKIAYYIANGLNAQGQSTNTHGSILDTMGALLKRAMYDPLLDKNLNRTNGIRLQTK